MKTVISIQYLRGFAALSVVASHTAFAAFPAQAGVDVFFVISGFITWSMTNRPTRPGMFLWRRLIRVAPLYWIATTLMALHQGAPLEAAVKSCLFIPYFGEGGNVWPVLVPGWTLNYEMFFYTLISLTLLFPRRLGVPLLAAAMLTLTASHAYVPGGDALLMTYTSPLMLEFLAGVGLAELWFRSALPGPWIAAPLIAAGLVGLLLPTMHDPRDTWRFLLWGLPSLMIVAGTVSLEAHGCVRRVAPLKLLGDASFSIYLFHPFILKTVMAYLGHQPQVVRSAGVMAVAAILGVVVFRLVERPMTVRLHELIRWRPGAQPARAQ